MCPHGRRLSCGKRHAEADSCLGRPLCPDCYDYDAAVVWNAHAPELWRRTTIAIRRRLARLARGRQLGKLQLPYAKVAEFQARGLVHFHAIFRLDATTGDGQLVPPAIGVEQPPGKEVSTTCPRGAPESGSGSKAGASQYQPPAPARTNPGRACS